MTRIFPIFSALILLMYAGCVHAQSAGQVMFYSSGAPLLSTDCWTISKNGTGTRRICGSDLTTYLWGNAPGTAGQVLFNSGGTVTTGSAASIRSLLGLSTVATTGAYGDLSGLPNLGSMAAASTGDYYTSASIDTLLSGKSDTGHSHSGLAPTGGGTGQVLKKNSATNYDYSWADDQAGTVTSVGITAPAAGISVAGSPITSSGSMTLSLANDLAAVEALSSTGYVKRTASDTWSTAATIPSSDVTGLGSMAYESAINYTSTGALAAVALSGDYDDLVNRREYHTQYFFDFGISNLPFAPFTNGSTGSSGAGSATVVTSEPGHYGITRMETGTLSTGSGVIQSQSQNVNPATVAGYKLHLVSWVKVIDLPTAGQDFHWFVGLLQDTAITTSPIANDSLGLYMNSSDTEFQCLKYRTTPEYADTGITAAANTWYKVDVVVDTAASATDVAYEIFIDDVSVCSGTGLDSRGYRIVPIQLLKFAGGTEVLTYIDKFYYREYAP